MIVMHFKDKKYNPLIFVEGLYKSSSFECIKFTDLDSTKDKEKVMMRMRVLCNLKCKSSLKT